MDRDELLALADRVEALTGPHDPALDEKAAEALGWHTRLVSRLGLSGRTRGSYLWFPPQYPWGTVGRARPPRLTGPKSRAQTAAALRALAHQSTAAQAGEGE